MLTQIGNEQWDFVDADGEQIALPPADAPAADIRFPTTWRVFGPLQSKSKIAPVQIITDRDVPDVVTGLRALPETLTIDGETLSGQDVELDGNSLDLNQFCEAYATVFFDAFGDLAARVGRQAYVFAELELDEETVVPFGAGSDFWMQWWIDGQPVYDTLEGGNKMHPPTHTDHFFRCTMAAGKHLLAVRLISGQTSWVLETGVLTPREEALSQITVSDRWLFLPDFDEIRPPHSPDSLGQTSLDWGHTMAINTDRCLAEETIECEFKMTGEANFGIILGAQDNGHYYTVQIPRWGQLWRARTFWAGICMADGSGHLRNLQMQLVPYVVCQWNTWIHLKVERRGNCIQTWIDGVRGPSVVDDTYGPGRVGITGFTRYTVRHLRIDGEAVDGPAWKAGDHRGQPWFLPVPTDDTHVLQGSGELLRLSDDEILMVFDDQRPGSNDPALPRISLMTSKDNGRNWQRHAELSLEPGNPRAMPWGLRWFVPRPGIVRAFTLSNVWTGGEQMPGSDDGALLTLQDSDDKCRTWSAPAPCELLGDWNRDIFREGCWNHIYGGTRLRDGTLLMLVLHGYRQLQEIIPNRGQGTWGSECAQPYVSRSEDDGMTWTEPVPMDNATVNDGIKPNGPHGGFSETCFAELPSGRIVAHARPFAAPYMWRTHSDDGGRSWRVVTYEPFSGAGGPQLLCTQSGYLVSVKRGPAVSLHISTDGGMNWDQGTIIDYHASFNGQILEVEPDVVLVVYPESMGEIRRSFTRAQLIRITADGTLPLKD